MISDRKDLFGTDIIDAYRGAHDFLSNFHLRPVTYKDITFRSSEHAYQWEKTLDETEKNWILFDLLESNGKVIQFQTTPGVAKSRGGQITLRDDWTEETRIQIMTDINRAKFTQSCTLREMLIETADAILIEGNTWCDNFWGDCRCRDCKSKPGLNMLGKIHMKLRDELKVCKGKCFS